MFIYGTVSNECSQMVVTIIFTISLGALLSFLIQVPFVPFSQSRIRHFANLSLPRKLGFMDLGIGIRYDIFDLTKGAIVPFIGIIP